ncbi:MAG: glycosyltransferase family 39 protein, partial [Thermoleophilia bacterium]|nr:glycosyltransferase family 39 protein [Thermoleophilia bacterium]
TVRATETTPPLSYCIAWLWAQVAGTSDFALRVPSIAFGAGTVLLGYRTAWLIAGRRAATITAALLAVTPLLVWFGQEARAYSLMAMLAAGLTLATVRWTRGAPGAWWHWSIWATLLVATHYPGWVFVAASAISVAALRIDRVQSVVLACAAPLVVAAAHLPLLAHQQQAGRTAWIGETSLGRRLLLAPKQLVTGLDAPHATLFGVLIYVALAPLIVLGARRVGVAAWLAAPLTLLLVVGGALLGPDIIVSRNLLLLAPPLLLLAGVGAATRTATAWVAAAVLVGLLALSIVITTDSDYVRPDWHGALVAAERMHAPGGVGFSPAMQRELVRWYTPDLAPADLDASSARVTIVAGDVIPNGEQNPIEQGYRARNLPGCSHRRVFDQVVVVDCTRTASPPDGAAPIG